MLDWQLIPWALWLGVLTSISPCPLATNIAALAFLSRRGGCRRAVAWSSAAYIAGRMIAYTALAAILAAGLFSAPAVSAFLRTKIEGLLGPGLILAGMVVAGWLPLKIPGSGGMNQFGTRLAERGLLGEFAMGIVFALAFCPTSAALFFGGLLPAMLKSGASVSLSLAYGAGTALPVIVAVALLTGGLAIAGPRLELLRKTGARLQQITGIVLILVGAWLTVRDMLR